MSRRREKATSKHGTVPVITDEDVVDALKAGRQRLEHEFTVTAVRYDPERDSVEIELAQGFGLRVPRAAIAELAALPGSAMTALEASPAGTGLDLDEHDVHISVHGLVLSLLSLSTMAAGLGKCGGTKSTPAKQESARLNGRLGGRPRKTPHAA